MNPVKKLLGFVETQVISRNTLKKNICKSPLSFNNSDYKIKMIRNNMMSKESGTSRQFQVKLKGPRVIYGRIKRIKTLNEAILYHQINQTNDPIKDYLPTYLGVFDFKGQQIDLELELKTKSINQLCKEYSEAYIVMKDLSRFDPTRPADDFKFVRPSLISNEQERFKHARSPHSCLYKMIQNAYLSLSDCSFAFQKKTKSSWFTWLIVSIKRLFCIKGTKRRLENHFIHLQKEELAKTIEMLQELKKSVTASNYAFTDSSLLFVPYSKNIEGNEVKSLSIHLIDLSHGMGREEGIDQFDVIQNDMAQSIDELIGMLNH